MIAPLGWDPKYTHWEDAGTARCRTSPALPAGSTHRAGPVYALAEVRMDVVTAAFTAIAFLVIAGLAASRGRVEPLAARFAVLCVVLFAYDALVLFATLSV